MTTKEMTEHEMRENTRWLGRFVAFHSIGPYAFVEYHPRKRDGCTVTKAIDTEITNFSAFVHGQSTHESFENLDSALAGAIAYRQEGANHRADLYFIAGMRKSV